MAQQNKLELQSSINSQIEDNNSNAITAADVRDNLLNMTDSLLFNSGSQGITGSLNVTNGITGDLTGTASYATISEVSSFAQNAETASFLEGSVTTADTASYVEGANVDGAVALATTADTASYVEGANVDGAVALATDAVSASYALTASFLEGSVTTADTASYVEGANVDGGVEYSLNSDAVYIEGTSINTDYSLLFSSYGNINTYYHPLMDGQNNITYNPSTNLLKLSEGKLAHGSYLNTASANYSHAEGWNTKTLGIGSHSEGQNTIAEGMYSHAEGGLTQAIGGWSHAEGSNCYAIGYASHAEGESTIASGSNQHVSGRFNTQGDDTSLLIVGNGAGFSTRKDAFKVRMSGSIVLPTTSSGMPSWTGTNGEMIPGDDGAGNYVLWVYLGGNWLTSSLGI